MADDELLQAGRIGILSTPLGDDTLVLVRFAGNEGLSELFEYRIEALSTNPNIDFNKALGQQCTVKISGFAGEVREFSGILTEAQWTGVKDAHFSYRLVLRPWLWLLSRTTDCRIFLNKKVPDIIREVFTDHEFGQGTDWESKLEEEGSFPTLEYCVQYRETDFNFVSRLMEREGIYYYFLHKDGRHKLVLANAKSSNTQILTMQSDDGSEFSSQQQLPYRPLTGHVPTGQHIYFWFSERQFRSGVFQLNDYNYEKPSAAMLCTKRGEKAYERGDMEVYDYPGNYVDTGQGQPYANFVFEAEQARDHRRKADGRAVSLFPGGVFTLKKGAPTLKPQMGQLPDPEFQEYLVVRCAHHYGDQTYSTARQAGVEGAYQGKYDLLPNDQPFRAPIVTAVPRIYGIQTAKVVNKQEGGSEEIDVEKLSEIYVQFYWDRRQHKEKRSCKLRCAQGWAGPKWGGQFIPRVGMEVVVQFLEGDPDRPIVTGAVYNANNEPPYDLPSNKTQSGWKSDSSKNHQGYNELMFEDKKNSELIRMHAQRDHLVQINSNQTGYVGATELNSPYQGGDQTWTVGRNRTWTIQKGNDYVEVKQGNLATDVDMGNYSLDVKMGNISVKADLGKIEIEAMQSITLKVGQNSIKIDQTGVTIKGIMLSFEGQAMAELKSPMTTVKGDGLLTLKGGLTMIN